MLSQKINLLKFPGGFGVPLTVALVISIAQFQSAFGVIEKSSSLQNPQKPVVAQDTIPKKTARQDTVSVVDTTMMSMPALDTTSSALKILNTEKATKESDDYNQGMQHRKAGEFESAAASFETALRDDPNNVPALVNLARTYVDLNQLEKASESVNRALAADSTNAEAYLIRGRIKNLNGDTQTAIEAYEKAIALDSDNPFPKNNLALIHIHDGRFNDALPLLEQAIAQRNDIAYFHNNLGIVYAQLDEHQKAVDEFQAALTIDPSDEKARANLDRAQKALDGMKPQETSSL